MTMMQLDTESKFRVVKVDVEEAIIILALDKRVSFKGYCETLRRLEINETLSFNTNC